MGKFYGVNRSFLMGNLGDAPELRHTNSGKPVCNLRIAVSEPPFSDGKEDVTTWHDVVVWGKPGEEAAQLRKGDTVMVFGRISTRSFEGNDGKKQYRTEIVADVIGRPMFGGERRGPGDDAGDGREPGDRDTGRDDYNRDGTRARPADNRGGGYRQDDRSRSNVSERDTREQGRPPARGRSFA